MKGVVIVARWQGVGIAQVDYVVKLLKDIATSFSHGRSGSQLIVDLVFVATACICEPYLEQWEFWNRKSGIC